jgi:hypothetical protein
MGELGWRKEGVRPVGREETTGRLVRFGWLETVDIGVVTGFSTTTLSSLNP